MSSARAFAEGLIASTPNANARALSCTDEMRHVNFILGTRGATTGDTVRLFMQNTSGTQVIELATFQINGLTATLTSLNAQTSLHQLDRLARPVTAINVGATISLATLGGALGGRSPILTLSVAGLTPDCLHLGLDIRRASGTGATSVVFPDVLVERTELFSDRLNQSGGIITGNYEPYPTRAKCATVCPPCPPLLSGALRGTFNFRNGTEGRSGTDGGIITSSDALPLRKPTRSKSVSADDAAPPEVASDVVQAKLLQQFRHAQVVITSTSRGGAALAFEASLRSYGYLDSLEAPVELRNGLELSGDSTFRNLYEQTQWVLAEMARGARTPALVQDAMRLSQIWADILNE